jgi:hypothetical protein
MKQFRNHLAIFIGALTLMLVYPAGAHADIFGGDDVILANILAEAIEQLTQLEQILGTGQDQISFLRQINEGVSQAMGIMRTANSTLKPGVFFQYQGLDQMLSLTRQVYGVVPHTRDSQMEELTDENVAEAISLHNDAFAYADGIDPEAERIKDFSKDTSPLGAARLTSESLGVLIHVSDQILRTQAEALNIQSENLALTNRREKLNSEQLQIQYEGLSDAFSHISPMSDAANLSAQPQ